MKKLCTFFNIIIISLTQAQSIEEINNLREKVLKNLSSYESLQYFNEVVSNEDAMKYDTAYFYCDNKGELIYINWKTRSHAFNIVGDGIDITELFFLDGQVVFRRNWGYSFENPQWHLEPNLDETKVHVYESTRRYFDKNGEALMDYEGRKTQGKHKDRFTLLDSIPLEEVRRLIWTDRCDDCIEEDYISVFKRLIEEK